MYGMYAYTGHDIDLSNYACTAFSTAVVGLSPTSYWPQTTNVGNWYIDSNDFFPDMPVDISGDADTTWYSPISDYSTCWANYGPNMDPCTDGMRRHRLTGARYSVSQAQGIIDGAFNAYTQTDTAGSYPGNGDAIFGGHTSGTFCCITGHQNTSSWNIPIELHLGLLSGYFSGSHFGDKNMYLRVVNSYPTVDSHTGSWTVDMSTSQSYNRPEGGRGGYSLQNDNDATPAGKVYLSTSDWEGFGCVRTPCFFCIRYYFNPVPMSGTGINGSDSGYMCLDYGCDMFWGWPTGYKEQSMHASDQEWYAWTPWFDPGINYISNGFENNLVFSTHFQSMQIESAWWRNTILTDAQVLQLWNGYKNNFL